MMKKRFETYKEQPSDRADYYVIAAFEGVLSEEEEQFLSEHADPRLLEEELAAYDRVKLTPDLSVTFPGKARLYRSERAIMPWIRRAGQVAAGILLMWGGYWLFLRDNRQIDNVIEVVSGEVALPANNEIIDITPLYSQIKSEPRTLREVAPPSAPVPVPVPVPVRIAPLQAAGELPMAAIVPEFYTRGVDEILALPGRENAPEQPRNQLSRQERLAAGMEESGLRIDFPLQSLATLFQSGRTPRVRN